MRKGKFWIFQIVNFSLIYLAVFSINCGDGKPPDIDKGLRIEHCPRSYDLDSADSLIVWLKASPISGARYVWFKGRAGSDTFTSCYAKRIEQSNDSQSVFICWKPFSNISVPVAKYRITGYMDVGR
ncbi:MAG: hypothetical protein ACPL28_11075 [bacterium]